MAARGSTSLSGQHQHIQASFMRASFTYALVVLVSLAATCTANISIAVAREVSGISPLDIASSGGARLTITGRGNEIATCS